MSTTNIFLRVLQGPVNLGNWIEGESSSLTYNGMLGWIEVESFSWNIKRKDKDKASKNSSTVVADKLTIKKHFDKASPAIYNMIRQDKQFTSIELHFADPTMMPVVGMSFLPVMMMILTNGHFELAKFNGSASGDGTTLEETLEIYFEDMVLTYSAADPITGYRTVPQKFHPTLTDKLRADGKKPLLDKLGL